MLRITAIASCAGQFLTIGVILEALGVCSRATGTWIGAVLIVLFTVFSGLWGVAFTDTVQAVVLLLCFGVIFPIAVFRTAGGWEAVSAFNAGGRMHFLQGISPISMVGWAVYYSLSVGADPAFSQRILSARSEKDAFIGQLAAWAFTLVVTGFTSALPGLAIGKIFPDITAGSQFTPLFLVTYMPAVLRGLMLAALLGLMLTSGDTYLLLLVSTVTDDLIRPRCGELTEKRALGINRIVCCLSAVVICAMALYVNSIYQLFKTGGGAYGAGVFIPLLLGCFWKKANRRAINTGMAVGCLVSFCFDMFLKIPLNWGCGRLLHRRGAVRRDLPGRVGRTGPAEPGGLVVDAVGDGGDGQDGHAGAHQPPEAGDGADTGNNGGNDVAIDQHDGAGEGKEQPAGLAAHAPGAKAGGVADTGRPVKHDAAAVNDAQQHAHLGRVEIARVRAELVVAGKQPPGIQCGGHAKGHVQNDQHPANG